VIWKPLRGFWKRFKTDNRYWKVVYCRETLNKKGKKQIRYENVPHDIPWNNDPVQQQEEDEETEIFEIPGVVKTPGTMKAQKTAKREDTSPEEETEEEEKTDGSFAFPTVFKPRGYPFVKRQQDETSPNLDSSFECYFNSSNRSSFTSTGHRNYHYGDSNSIYTITTEMNESVSDYNLENGSDDETSATTGAGSQNESRFRTFSRTFLKKFSSERAEEAGEQTAAASGNNKKNNSKSTKRNNNNTSIQQFYTITECETKYEQNNTKHVDHADSNGDIAVLPMHNDVIYMHNIPSRTNSKSTTASANDSGTSDYWSMQNDDEVTMTTTEKSKDGKSRKVKHSNSKKDIHLYGVSTSMFKQQTVHQKDTPEPNFLMKRLEDNSTINGTSTGLVDRDSHSNVFYA